MLLNEKSYSVSVYITSSFVKKKREKGPYIYYYKNVKIHQTVTISSLMGGIGGRKEHSSFIYFSIV